MDPCNIKYDGCWVIFLSFKIPEPHLEKVNMVRQDNMVRKKQYALFMEFELHRTTDQVS